MDAFWGTNSTKPEFIWKSTGLYVKAGKVVEIEVKRELFNIIKVSFYLLNLYLCYVIQKNKNKSSKIIKF